MMWRSSLVFTSLASLAFRLNRRRFESNLVREAERRLSPPGLRRMVHSEMVEAAEVTNFSERRRRPKKRKSAAKAA